MGMKSLASAVLVQAMNDLTHPRTCRVHHRAAVQADAARFFNDDMLTLWCQMAEIPVQKVRDLIANQELTVEFLKQAQQRAALYVPKPVLDPDLLYDQAPEEQTHSHLPILRRDNYMPSSVRQY